ncbi:MAG: tripartite tricarboxylate transporter TctB family protein [Shimia sp.]
MKFNDAVFGVFFMVFSAVLILHVRTFPSVHGQDYGPADFPTLIAIGLFICGVLLVIRGVQSRLNGSLVGGAPIAVGDWIRDNSTKLNFALVIGSVLLFYFAVEAVGFILLTLPMLFVLLLRFGNSLRTSVIGSVVVVGAIVLLFGRLLRVPLPIGPFGF